EVEGGTGRRVEQPFEGTGGEGGRGLPLQRPAHGDRDGQASAPVRRRGENSTHGPRVHHGRTRVLADVDAREDNVGPPAERTLQTGAHDEGGRRLDGVDGHVGEVVPVAAVNKEAAGLLDRGQRRAG